MPKKYIVEDIGAKMFYTEVCDEEWTKDKNQALEMSEHEKDTFIKNVEPMGYACIAHEV